MAKNKVPTDGSSTNAVTSSPFAALGALRASLPDVPVAEAPSSSSNEPKAPARFSPKVVVRKEKKGHGGKTVTLVSGVLSTALDDVSGVLKNKLGVGARIEGEDIVVQGDVGDRVVVVLEQLGAKKIVRGS